MYNHDRKEHMMTYTVDLLNDVT